MNGVHDPRVARQRSRGDLGDGDSGMQTVQRPEARLKRCTLTRRKSR